MFGQLAAEQGLSLAVCVMSSAAGFYIGTADDSGPVSRESVEYWPSKDEACNALAMNAWTQRPVN